MNYKIVLTFLFLLFLVVPTKAQRIAVSTNLVDLVTMTPNLEIEMPFNHKQSFVFATEVNPSVLRENISFKHLTVSSEYRFWLNQVMYKHYIGAYAQLTSNDYQLGSLSDTGDYVALGASYGYSFLMSRRVNFVPNIAIGCGYCFDGSASGSRFKPMLLNVGVSFQYLIK